MKRISLIAETINGVITKSPVEIIAPCSGVKPLGIDVVRNFDIDECILAKRVFLIYYNGDVIGTTQFKSLDEYLSFFDSGCSGLCNRNFLTIKGCRIRINNCLIVSNTYNFQWAWVFEDPYENLKIGIDNLQYQGSVKIMQDKNQISVPFGTAPPGSYLVIKINKNMPLLTRYMQSLGIVGPIPDSVWRAPFLYGLYNYYVTIQQTTFALGNSTSFFV